MNKETIIKLITETLKSHARSDDKLPFSVTIGDVAIWISDAIGKQLACNIFTAELKQPDAINVNSELIDINSKLNKLLSLIDNNYNDIGREFSIETRDEYTINKENNVTKNIESTDPKQTNLLDQIEEVTKTTFNNLNATSTCVGVDLNYTPIEDIPINYKPLIKIKLTHYRPKMSDAATRDPWIDFTPTYGSKKAACMDCKADIKSMPIFTRNVNLEGTVLVIEPNQRVTVPLGFSCATPKGYKLSIKPRSGLANKNGLTIVNSPGTVDEDYRGIVMVILLNTGSEDININHGDRICQAELERYEQAEIEVVDELSDTKRGLGGFGSTGIK